MLVLGLWQSSSLPWPSPQRVPLAHIVGQVGQMKRVTLAVVMAALLALVAQPAQAVGELPSAVQSLVVSRSEEHTSELPVTDVSRMPSSA